METTDLGSNGAIDSVKVVYTPGEVTTNSLAHIQSEFYSDPSYNLSLRNLGPHNVNNTQAIANSIVSSPPPPPGHRDSITYSFNPTRIGDYNYFKTASKTTRFHFTDKVEIPLYDESFKEHIGPWKAATEEPHGMSTGERPEFQGIIMGTHSQVIDPQFNKLGTVIEYYGPMQYIGTAISRAEEFRQKLERFPESPIGSRMFEEYPIGLSDVSYVGIFPSESPHYSIARLEDGKVIISSTVKGPEEVSDILQFYGMSYEDLVNLSLGEEFMHLERRSIDIDFGSVEDIINEELQTKAQLLGLLQDVYKGAEPDQDLRGRLSNTIDFYYEHYENTDEIYHELLKDYFKTDPSQEDDDSCETQEYVASRLGREAGESKAGIGLESIVEQESGANGSKGMHSSVDRNETSDSDYAREGADGGYEAPGAMYSDVAGETAADGDTAEEGDAAAESGGEE